MYSSGKVCTRLRNVPGCHVAGWGLPSQPLPPATHTLPGVLHGQQATTSNFKTSPLFPSPSLYTPHCVLTFHSTRVGEDTSVWEEVGLCACVGGGALWCVGVTAGDEGARRMELLRASRPHRPARLTSHVKTIPF